jgi:hypothetical protein
MGQLTGDIGRRLGTRRTLRLSIGIGGGANAATRGDRRWRGARSGLASAAVLVLAVSGLWAGDITEGGVGGVSAAVAASATDRAHGFEVPVQPWIHKSMPEPTRERLEAGFRLAAERVVEVEACGGLFTRFGANGLDALRLSLYFPPGSYLHEIEVCGRNPIADSREAENLAVTKTGGRVVWICRNFARVSTETAAVTLIHEALHCAGLSERPTDRLAMSSAEITEMVRAACAP